MRALIVGAGLAGPVTAMALQQVGIEPVIVEAHPRGDDEIGSYLTVTPNGLDALAAIGALDDAAVDRLAHPAQRDARRAPWRTSATCRSARPWPTGRRPSR